ncbi:hypothetical protein NEDG_01728 [Nematocida displodere]|uniref:Dual specificity protein phosphatase n=1 Tax=Nematocida displodere TaxID=1805483 RepID=A0A177EDW7_9MICR|nr:hypothetical protein NEDG_01728 [Nematocida displodere]
MEVSCRKCRGAITGAWLEHKGCSVLISEGRVAGARMEEITSGRIYCNRCNNALGRFMWQGTKCICGTWLFPYIAIHKTAVDVIEP